MSIATRISIVTPSFNQAAYLPSCLDSVLSQNYPNLEYVVMDGGSTDGSAEIIRQYSDRLAYWTSSPDGGHGRALNEGFAQTSGDIMGWLNSDDLYLPWTLATVAEIFDTCPEVDWITGINVHWDRCGRMVEAYSNHKNEYDYLLGRYAWIQQESTFWRRSLWDVAGGRIDDNYKFMVDGELWSRFFQHAKLYHVKCVLGGFRVWGENRSAQNLALCKLEMQDCIATMRAASDAGTKQNVARLSRLATLKSILRPIRFEKIVERTHSKFLYTIGYDQLSNAGAGWEHDRLMYRL